MKKITIAFFILMLIAGCSFNDSAISSPKTYEVYNSATKLQLVQEALTPYFDAYHNVFVIYTVEGEDEIKYTFDKDEIIIFDPEQQKVVNDNVIKGVN